MKILITGASGFIGSFLYKQLLKDSEHQIALLLRNPNDAWRIKSELSQSTIIAGTLADPTTYRVELIDFKPDVILHLAWRGVDGANRNQLDQVANLQDLCEFMQISGDAGAHTFIGLGSQAEYGPHNKAIHESFPTNPTTMYGASKLGAYKLARVLSSSLDMRFSWLRLFSSYGPMDHPSWLLPYLINTFLRGESPNVTKGEQKWDYIFIDDVISGIISVLNSKTASGVFNLGSGKSTSLKNIIQKTRDFIDPSIKINFGAIPYRADQVMHLEADITGLNNATGWSPKTSLDEGLQETIHWWKSQMHPINN